MFGYKQKNGPKIILETTPRELQLFDMHGTDQGVIWIISRKPMAQTNWEYQTSIIETLFHIFFNNIQKIKY